MTAPATPAARAVRARRGAVERGAVRVEVILRDPRAITALMLLRDQLGSQRAAIEHALRVAGR